MRPETIKLPEEDIDSKLLDISFSSDFLDLTAKQQQQIQNKQVRLHTAESHVPTNLASYWKAPGQSASSPIGVVGQIQFPSIFSSSGSDPAHVSNLSDFHLHGIYPTLTMEGSVIQGPL